MEDGCSEDVVASGSSGDNVGLNTPQTVPTRMDLGLDGELEDSGGEETGSGSGGC